MSMEDLVQKTIENKPQEKTQEEEKSETFEEKKEIDQQKQENKESYDELLSKVQDGKIYTFAEDFLIFKKEEEIKVRTINGFLEMKKAEGGKAKKGEKWNIIADKNLKEFLNSVGIEVEKDRKPTVEEVVEETKTEEEKAEPGKVLGTEIKTQEELEKMNWEELKTECEKVEASGKLSETYKEGKELENESPEYKQLQEYRANILRKMTENLKKEFQKGGTKVAEKEKPEKPKVPEIVPVENLTVEQLIEKIAETGEYLAREKVDISRDLQDSSLTEEQRNIIEYRGKLIAEREKREKEKTSVSEAGEESFENRVVKVKKELFENAGNKSKEELVQLISDVEKILDEEKEKGKGKLKDKISEIRDSEFGKEKFTDESIVYLPADGEAIFIGDTHGDPDATVSIMEQEKFIEAMEKGEKNKYLVFLGDYVDRGKGDVENIEQIIALYKKYPDNVVLLRGNHEGKETTDKNFLFRMLQKYGDQNAIKSLIKYDDKHKKYYYALTKGWEEKFKVDDPGKELYEKYQELFKKLPGVAVCGNGIIGVHGGIPSRDIKSLKDLNDKNLLYQMRWNDPSSFMTADRELGNRGSQELSVFGEKAFGRFMNTTGGKIMIRAHEEAGNFENRDKCIEFKNKLVTIFSTGKSEKGGYDDDAMYAKFNLGSEIDKIGVDDIKKVEYIKPNYELKAEKPKKAESKEKPPEIVLGFEIKDQQEISKMSLEEIEREIGKIKSYIDGVQEKAKGYEDFVRLLTENEEFQELKEYLANLEVEKAKREEEQKAAPEKAPEKKEGIPKNMQEIIDKLAGYEWEAQKRIAEVTEEKKDIVERYRMADKSLAEEEIKTAKEVIKLKNLGTEASLTRMTVELAASPFEKNPYKRMERAAMISRESGALFMIQKNTLLKMEIELKRRESEKELGKKKGGAWKSFKNAVSGIKNRIFGRGKKEVGGVSEQAEKAREGEEAEPKWAEELRSDVESMRKKMTGYNVTDETPEEIRYVVGLITGPTGFIQVIDFLKNKQDIEGIKEYIQKGKEMAEKVKGKIGELDPKEVIALLDKIEGLRVGIYEKREKEGAGDGRETAGAEIPKQPEEVVDIMGDVVKEGKEDTSQKHFEKEEWHEKVSFIFKSEDIKNCKTEELLPKMEAVKVRLSSEMQQNEIAEFYHKLLSKVIDDIDKDKGGLKGKANLKEIRETLGSIGNKGAKIFFEDVFERLGIKEKKEEKKDQDKKPPKPEGGAEAVVGEKEKKEFTEQEKNEISLLFNDNNIKKVKDAKDFKELAREIEERILVVSSKKTGNQLAKSISITVGSFPDLITEYEKAPIEDYELHDKMKFKWANFCASNENAKMYIEAVFDKLKELNEIRKQKEQDKDAGRKESVSETKLAKERLARDLAKTEQRMNNLAQFIDVGIFENAIKVTRLQFENENYKTAEKINELIWEIINPAGITENKRDDAIFQRLRRIAEIGSLGGVSYKKKEIDAIPKLKPEDILKEYNEILEKEIRAASKSIDVVIPTEFYKKLPKLIENKEWEAASSIIAIIKNMLEDKRLRKLREIGF